MKNKLWDRTEDPKWTAVDAYLGAHLLDPDPVLDAALAASEAAGLPPIHVDPLQGKLLMLLAASMGARNILEIGTLGGYSTIWLARGLGDGGRVVTLDMNEDFAKVARANFANAGLSDCIEVRVGTALDTLAALHAEGAGPFDLVFIDADKPNTAHYLDWAVKLARKGTLIVVDNVVREGAILAEQSDSEHVKGMRSLFARVAEDPRITGTAFQTVGAKGHDGLAVIRVIEAP